MTGITCVLLKIIEPFIDLSLPLLVHTYAVRSLIIVSILVCRLTSLKCLNVLRLILLWLQIVTVNQSRLQLVCRYG